MSKISGIQMVRQVTWLYHLNTGHPYFRIQMNPNSDCYCLNGPLSHVTIIWILDTNSDESGIQMFGIQMVTVFVKEAMVWFAF